jgi:hypothetical protein
MPTEWNYPEAYLLGETFIKNLTGITSRDRTNRKPAYLYGDYLPGNKSIDTVSMEDYYQTVNVATRSFYPFVVPTCIPDLDVVQHMDISNFTMSLKNPDHDPSRTMAIIWGTAGGNYMKIVLNLNNFYLYDIEGAAYSIGLGGTAIDETYVSNFVVDNWNTANNLIFGTYSGKVVMRNITYTNSKNQNYAFIFMLFIDNVELHQIHIQNFTGSLSPISSLISFRSGGLPTYTLDEITLVDSKLFKTSVFAIYSPINVISLVNIFLSNSTISSGYELFYFSRINHAVIFNNTVENFGTSDSENEGTIIVKINSLNLDSDYENELYEVGLRI